MLSERYFGSQRFNAVIGIAEGPEAPAVHAQPVCGGHGGVRAPSRTPGIVALNMRDHALTLMAVHAHPDDEASSTGGILARYSAEGVETIVVTCTNGELGDSAGGAKPGEPGHDRAAVAAQRRRELERSCEVLGVSHLEMLGYRDSGMEGWDDNQDSASFWQTPVEVAAQPLAAVMEQHRPDIVVTYDDYGFYGHPDHIQAHRITVAALRMTRLDVRLYCPAVRRSRLGVFRERMTHAGVDMPPIDETRFGSPDADIAASIDCRDYAAKKREALQAHASQHENIFFLRLPLADFTDLFGTEEFTRLPGHTGASAPADDLFTGLRPQPVPSRVPPHEAAC